MTQEQIEQYARELGWPPETVVAVFSYWAHGGP